MKYLKRYGSFEQPEGTGKDSYWGKEIDGELQIITLTDILNYLDEVKEMDPNEIKHLLIDVERDSNRIESADLNYPVILTSIRGEIKSILDGQHRVLKAIKNGKMVKVRILDLDSAPEKIKSILLF